MSIWEVRNNKQNFVYSKIMLWVAFDRGLRLSEKRCLPCPNRAAWMAARDEIYEEIMNKGTAPLTPFHLHPYPFLHPLIPPLHPTTTTTPNTNTHQATATT